MWAGFTSLRLSRAEGEDAQGSCVVPRLRLLLRLRRRRVGVLCALESFRDWCYSFLTLSGVAHLASVACFALQATCLTLYLQRYLNGLASFTLLVEVPLFCHIVWFWREESAARAAPTQWLVYSWVHAAKVVVLFCKVMPRLPNTSDADRLSVGRFSLASATFGDLYSPTNLANLLLFTPVFYALLMLRMSKGIFGSFANKITVDLLMLFDMLWHVIMDMVDQVDMFYYSRLPDWLSRSVLEKHQRGISVIQSAIPMLLFLSITLQAQSLPGVVVDHWRLPGPPIIDDSEDARSSSGKNVSKRNGATGLGRQENSLRSESSNVDSVRSQLPPPAPVPRHAEPAKVGVAAPPRESLLSSFSKRATMLGAELRQGSSESIRPMRNTTSGPQDWRMSTEASDTSLAGVVTGDAGTSRGSNWISWNITALNLRRSSHEAANEHNARLRAELCDRSRAQRAEKQRRRRFQTIIHCIQRHNIFIARKRSAVVSIFFVDAPFLLVRIALWILTLREGNSDFPALGVKNAVCIVLNALQYSLVQMVNRDSCLDVQRRLAVYYCTFPGGDCPRQDVGGGIGVLPKSAEGASQASGATERPDEPNVPVDSPMAAVSDMSTPQLLIADPKDSPQASIEGAPQMKNGKFDKLQEALKQVRKDGQRSTSICVHFWAILVAFGIGFSIAKGENLLQRLALALNALMS